MATKAGLTCQQHDTAKQQRRQAAEVRQQDQIALQNSETHSLRHPAVQVRNYVLV